MNPEESIDLSKTGDDAFASVAVPLEIWIKIFTYLNSAELLKVSAVARLFYFAAEEVKLFWQRRVQAYLAEQGLSFSIEAVGNNRSVGELRQFYYVLLEVGHHSLETKDQSIHQDGYRWCVIKYSLTAESRAFLKANKDDAIIGFFYYLIWFHENVQGIKIESGFMDGFAGLNQETFDRMVILAEQNPAFYFLLYEIVSCQHPYYRVDVSNYELSSRLNQLKRKDPSQYLMSGIKAIGIDITNEKLFTGLIRGLVRDKLIEPRINCCFIFRALQYFMKSDDYNIIAKHALKLSENDIQTFEVCDKLVSIISFCSKYSAVYFATMSVLPHLNWCTFSPRLTSAPSPGLLAWLSPYHNNLLNVYCQYIDTNVPRRLFSIESVFSNSYTLFLKKPHLLKKFTFSQLKRLNDKITVIQLLYWNSPVENWDTKVLLSLSVKQAKKILNMLEKVTRVVSMIILYPSLPDPGQLIKYLERLIENNEAQASIGNKHRFFPALQDQPATKRARRNNNDLKLVDDEGLNNTFIAGVVEEMMKEKMSEVWESYSPPELLNYSACKLA